MINTTQRFLRVGILLLGTLMFSCASPPETVKNTLEISGTILHTRSYCGGAPPSEALLAEYKTPSPLAGLHLSIKQGKVNALDVPIISQIITDEQGAFSVTLPEGEYILLLNSQTNRDIFNEHPHRLITNAEKMEAWWSSGIAQMNQEHRNIDITLHQKCDLPLGVSYMRYTGPVRP